MRSWVRPGTTRGAAVAALCLAAVLAASCSESGTDGVAPSVPPAPASAAESAAQAPDTGAASDSEAPTEAAGSETAAAPTVLEFVLQHTSEVDIMYELQPSTFQKEGTHEEARYLLADAQFVLQPAGDGTHRGSGTLEFTPDTWRMDEKKIAIGGQSGPDQTCRTRSLDTLLEWTNGTVEVEGVRVDGGAISGTMTIGDVHDMWEHVYSVLSGPCGEVRSDDEFQYFLNVLGTGLGGRQVAHEQTEMPGAWYAIDLAAFSEPADGEPGDLASRMATFDTRGAVHGSEYTTVTIRPAG